MINSLFFYINTINFLFASAGLLVLLVTAVLAYDYVWNRSQIYQKCFARFVWWIIALVTIGGVFITLLYSEVFGFVPCSLCWLQRIALYPQAMLALVAFRLRDQVFFPLYGIILSIFGLVVAIYQYIYQMLPKELLEAGMMPCLADGTADCGKKVMEVFGFVTFPFLSGVLFLFLIVLFLNLRTEKNKTLL